MQLLFLDVLDHQAISFREALTEAEIGGGSENCLIVPDISKSEFEAFHSAIFAAEKDNSVDAFVVIRTAEVLGIDFVSSSLIFPTNSGPF